MAEYYTRDEWVEMIQAKMGTQVLPTNPRFPTAICVGNVIRQIHQWQPWLPGEFQDSVTEILWTGVPTAVTELVGPLRSITRYRFTLPASCARVLDVNVAGQTDQYVELYGFDGLRNNLGGTAEYDERCQTLSRTKVGVRLFCKRGKDVFTYPALSTQELNTMMVEVGMRTYIDSPTASGSMITIPKVAVPFHLSGAAADGKWPDFRAGEAQALQAEFLNTLKAIFGVEDRAKAQAAGGQTQ
jgi:hypothetical protein